MPEMGFTTLITIYLPVGMNNKKPMQNFPYAPNYGRSKLNYLGNVYIFLIDFNYEAFYRKNEKMRT